MFLFKPIISAGGRHFINKYAKTFLKIEETALDDFNGSMDLINMELNLSSINSLFLASFPIKIIDGKIGKISLKFENLKLNIEISDITITLMPITNKNMKNKNLALTETKIKEVLTRPPDPRPDPVDTFVNALALRVGNIKIKNISVKLLTFEPSVNTLDNPIFAFYIFEILIKKNEVKGANTKKLFLDNFSITINKICGKIEDNIRESNKDIELISKYEREGNIEKYNEKLFAFFIKENTFFAMNYLNKESITILINTEILEERPKNCGQNEIAEEMIFNVDINIIEAIISPENLFRLRNLINVCMLIFCTGCSNNSTLDIKNDLIKNKQLKQNDEKLPPAMLSHDINKFSYKINTSRIAFILLENKGDKNIPKLFTFLLEKELCQTKEYNQNNSDLFDFDNNVKALENYYSYFQDNFILLNISSGNFDSDNISLNKIELLYVKQKFSMGSDMSNLTLKNKKMEEEYDSSIDNSQSNINNKQDNDNNDNDIFESCVESKSQVLFVNYKKYLGVIYDYSDFEIMEINSINVNLNLNEKGEYAIKIRDFIYNFHFFQLFLYLKYSTQNKYFFSQLENNDTIKEEKEIDSINLNKTNNTNINSIKSNLNIGEINNEQNQNKKNSNNSDENDSIVSMDNISNSKHSLSIQIENTKISLLNFEVDPKRFDSNIYFFNFFIENVRPCLFYKNKRKDYFSGILIGLDLDSISSKYKVNICLNNGNYKIKEWGKKIEIGMDEMNLKWGERYRVIKYEDKEKNEKLSKIIIKNYSKINLMFNDINDELTFNFDMNLMNEYLVYNNTILYFYSFFQIYSDYLYKIYKTNVKDLFSAHGYMALIEKNNNINDDKKLDLFADDDLKDNDDNGFFNLNFNVKNLIFNYNEFQSSPLDKKNLMKLYMKEFELGFGMGLSKGLNNILEGKKTLYNEIYIKLNSIELMLKEDNSENYLLLGRSLCKRAFEDNVFLDFYMKYNDIEEEGNIKDNESVNSDDNNNIINQNEEDNLKNKLSLEDRLQAEYVNFIKNHQIKLLKRPFETKVSLNGFFFNFPLNSILKTKKNLNLFLNSTLKFSNGMTIDPNEKIDLIPLSNNREMTFIYEVILEHFYFDFYPNNKENKVRKILICFEKFKYVFINLNKQSLKIDSITFYLSPLISLQIFTLPEFSEIIPGHQLENSQLKLLGFSEFAYLNLLSLEKNVNKTEVNSDNFVAYLFPDIYEGLKDLLVIFGETFGEIWDKKKEDIKEEIIKKENNDYKIDNKKDDKIDDKEEKANLTLYQQNDNNDFMIVSFIENHGIKKIKNKNDNSEIVPKVNIKIISIRIYLYSEKCFIHNQDTKIIKSILKSIEESSKSNENIRSGDDSDYELEQNSPLEIDYDYISKKKYNKVNIRNNKNVIDNNNNLIARKGNNNYILFYLEEIDINTINFQTFKLIISDFFVKDNIGKIYRKLISPFDGHKKKFLKIEVDLINEKDIYDLINKENNNNNNNNKINKVANINAEIESLNISLSQDTLIFLMEYFGIKFQKEINSNPQNIENLENNNEIKNDNINESELIINKININEFNICFNYRSDVLSLKKLKKGDYTQFLNFSNLIDFKLNFKEYKKNHLYKNAYEAINLIYDFWYDDIVNKQLVKSVFDGVAIFKPFTNLITGVFGIVYQPIVSVVSGEGLKPGVEKGFINLFSSVTNNVLLLGGKIYKGILYLGGATDNTYLTKQSIYKQIRYNYDKDKMNKDEIELKK